MAHATCELCERMEVEVTRHHLIPRARHRKPQIRRAFRTAELTGRLAMLCRPCHRFIHQTLNERELATAYNTIADLRAQPDIAKFITWIKNKPPGLIVHSARPRR